MDNGNLPSEELLVKAAKMDIELDNADEYAAMKCFWDVAAPAVLGSHSWGDTYVGIDARRGWC